MTLVSARQRQVSRHPMAKEAKTMDQHAELMDALITVIGEALISHDAETTNDCGPMNLVDGVVHGSRRIANALKQLGLGDAATPFGAIEALCVELKDSSQRIAEGLHAIADAIRDHD
jgi:hypothetical protein